MPLPGAPKPGPVDARMTFDDALATKRIYQGESTPSASAATATGDELLKQQMGSVTSCTALLVKGLNDSKILDTFKAEVQRYRDVQLSRLEVILTTSEKEIDEHKQMQLRMTKEISDIKLEIEDLTGKLSRARQVRTQRDEVEKLAKETNLVPTVKTLNETIKNVGLQVSQIDESIRKTHARVQVRKKQFKLVIQDIHELEQQLDEDL